VTSWSDVFEAIRLAIVAAGPFADATVIDYEGITPFAPPDVALIRLRVLSDVAVEFRPIITLGAPAQADGRCTRTLEQQREVVISVHCEALTQGIAKEAAHAIESGLHMIGPEDPDTLDNTGPEPWLDSCSIVYVGQEGPILSHTRPVDGHSLAVYTLDLRFRYVFSRSDTLVRTIATAEISFA
jgi:hypothetical protein